MNTYFGTYEPFSTPSKKDAAVLLGADNLVGDRYSIDIEIHGEEHRAWLISRFNQRIGFFNPEFSRKLSLLKAQGLALTALLSFVAFTETEEEGRYWGEMAVIAFPPEEEQVFDHYINNVAKRLEDNIRPDINLSSDGINKVLESDGAWTPDKTIPMPKKEKHLAIIKCRRSLSDKMIEEGRKGNKGCYAFSWAFLLVLVALIIFGLKSCGLF